MLSVIICSYNPNPEIFIKCLDCVDQAIRHLKDVEVLIIDNNSGRPLAEESYLMKYLRPPYKFLLEKEQGLTPARLKGIRESVGELVVFVDDDNFVHSDYFSKGLEIAETKKFIGSFSGQVKLIFEITPDEWTRKYWGLLVYREFENDLWSNLPHLDDTMPCGAGLFVRREVADYYFGLHETGQRNVMLDRTGSSLFSGGDNDLAACACDQGMGVGLFHELVLDHFIPAKRLEKRYLLDLARGIAASSIVLKAYRSVLPDPNTPRRKLANFLRTITKSKIEREFFIATLAGVEDGLKLLKRHSAD